MGNNCCLRGRNEFCVSIENSNGFIANNKDIKHQHDLNKPLSEVSNKRDCLTPLNHVKMESLTYEKSKETSQCSASDNIQLLKRIKNITKYKTKDRTISPLNNCYSTNSKLTYSVYNENSSSFNNMKNGKPQQENKNLRTKKRPNELLNYISKTCWNHIVDCLNLSELRQVGITCSILSLIASSPTIIKKYYKKALLSTISDETAKENLKTGLKLNLKKIVKNEFSLKRDNEQKSTTINPNPLLSIKELYGRLENANNAFDSNMTEAENVIYEVSSGNLGPGKREGQVYLFNINDLISYHISQLESKTNLENLKASKASVKAYMQPSIRLSNDSKMWISKTRDHKFSGSIVDVSYQSSCLSVSSSRTQDEFGSLMNKSE